MVLVRGCGEFGFNLRSNGHGPSCNRLLTHPIAALALYNEAWPVDIESAMFREGMTIGCSLIGHALANEIWFDETSERKSNNCAGGCSWSFPTIDESQDAGEIPAIS
jgi:hypothetical protein